MRSRSRIIALVLLMVVLGAIMAPVAMAAPGDPFDVTGSSPESFIRTYGLRIWNIFLLIGGLFTVIMCAVHGLRIMNSGHNPQARALAQQGLNSWMIGAGVFFGSMILTSLVKGFFN